MVGRAPANQSLTRGCPTWRLERCDVHDAYLEDRLTRYDGWVREGRIPYSSRVVPVCEALNLQQWILPAEQVLEFLRSASSYALTDCTCRTLYQRCDNPLEVCFLLEDAADQAVADGFARRVSLDEAADVLRQAEACGLVHLTIYEPEHRVYAVCSCCSCCCHDLQFLQLYGRSDLVARSEYRAQTDMEACTQCGACVERCPFGAREWRDGRLIYSEEACYGCGLCVTVCPTGATTLGRSPEFL
jgi:NAD-dependent dihydropyrimidine dehydrogenase PreA subunit